MSKELPYFRFTANDWLNDDISFESYELKGFFIDFISYYWARECHITKVVASKRFANAKHLLESAIKSGLIKEITMADGEILLEINFLKIQHDECMTISKKRSKSGKLGGLAKVANAKQMLSKRQANAKQMPIYKDKDKDKDKDNTFMVVDYLNSICNTKYKTSSQKTKQLVEARKAEGFTFEDFKTVIAKKHSAWDKTEFAKFLRPETLFGNKFESYLNELKEETPNQEFATVRRM